MLEIPEMSISYGPSLSLRCDDSMACVPTIARTSDDKCTVKIVSVRVPCDNMIKLDARILVISHFCVLEDYSSKSKTHDSTAIVLVSREVLVDGWYFRVTA